MLPWLLFLLVASATAQTCPGQSNQLPFCSTNVIFVLDATNYLTNTDIATEMNFAWSNLLPSLNYVSGGQQATFVSYGASSEFTPLTAFYPMACSQLSNLIDDSKANGGKKMTLTSTMNQLFQDYKSFMDANLHIQLFSASTDATDISLAGQFVRNNMPMVSFTVVSLSGRSDLWTNVFPYYQLIVTYPWSLSSSNLPRTCLLNTSCGNRSGCSVTTTSTSTTTTTTTTTPRPTTTAAPNSDPQCQCNYPTVWNDVMFLFDASQSTGPLGLQELLGYVQTSFGSFNIQKAFPNNGSFHTRIGIITYGSTVTTQYPLGTIDGQDLQSMNQLPYQGGNLTDLDLAIRTAATQLKGSYSRPNARSVIVVLASGYNSSPRDYPSPGAAATDFTNQGGVVVVYEFNQPHTQRSPVLQNLTIPAYYILNTADTGYRMQDAMCDANCHCPDPSMQFTSSPSNPNKPTGNCYTPVSTLGNFNVASNKCLNLWSGLIAQGKTSSKTFFLESLFPQKTNFLTGMKWDNFSGRWLWVDGTPVTGGYQPWFSGIPSHQTGSDCVYVYNNGGLLQWVPTDCRNGFFYVCETQACSSTRFCKVM